MKNIQKIVVLTALAASFAVVNSASAEGQFLSPKAQGQQTRVVPGTNHDPDLAHAAVQSASPKLQQQPVMAGNSKNDPDLAHQDSNLPGTPKLKQQQPMQFEIAPTK